MCGIIGVVVADGRDVPDFQDCIDALVHRGPDGRGSTRLGRVLLGHRRLSIIDVREAALQPMRDDAGTIIFNGEIYDYETHRRALSSAGVAFRTHSDTEVLLHGLARQGAPFLRGVHGMYAFAWLSPDGEKLLLARDHAGMKPLYIASGAFGVAFASEVRALSRLLRTLGVEPRLDRCAVADVLAWGSVSEPRTILEGVRMVPADCVVTIDVASSRVVDTHAIGTTEPRDEPGDARAAIDGIRHAIQRHLVSDRPVAIFLSSGLDSSVIACEASTAAQPPEAITIRLGSSGTDDEADLAAELCRRLGIRQHIIELHDWRARLDRALESYDQPSVDGLNTFVISGVARDLGFPVALSGVGADEVFGGYSHLHSRGLQLARRARLPFLGSLGEVAERHTFGRARRLSIMIASMARGEAPLRSVRRLMSDATIARLMPGAPSTIERVAADPLVAERETYLRNTLLRDTDVMGMANSIEIRAPFLDPEILRSAAALGTDAILQRGRVPKWLLRDEWGPQLPSRTRTRRKTGFTLDVAGWLRAEGAEHVARAKETLRASPVFDGSVAEAMVSRFQHHLERGRTHSWVPLFALVQIGAQLRRWT
jgi:asparagine synthase (glutamine-hydrolysing)